ncbi:hypothetical protein D9613_005088 [Agrocybe pediades]|uniref:Gamma interferon inducible lysosomal thiol reductase GILT n=1 Tax=Agrocybe pediades TaxID=84607 RepID=A0A8H4QXS3_9AGAR|nr:hypothetical protein D9613_005088 [Agrocybe pediades]KAF9568911.1 hypothetical protein CPC08DRAFT_678444 [Agrocybe pediades]
MKSSYTALLTSILSSCTVLATHLPLSIYSSQSRLNVEDSKVPVQLGVMSQCPDALLCESVFDQVLQKVSNKVDLSLVYVANIDDNQPDFGVRCMHGPQECAGNVQQLCVKKHEPFENWWAFVQCHNFQGREKIGRPDVALKCARAAGIDWENSGAAACIGLDGEAKAKEGVNLLKESTLLGKELGIKNSCTVLISGKAVCVHDGTWRNCENGHTVSDFVKQIEDEYKRLNED